MVARHQRDGRALSPEHLEKLLYIQLRKSTAMQADIAYYRRLEKGHADKSYSFLWDVLRRYIEEEVVDKNQRTLNAEFSGSGGGQNKALVAGEGGGNKGCLALLAPPLTCITSSTDA